MQLEQDAASDWCLQHGGEMGARMRALDWSRTPLGPPAQWPQQLKLAVALCLRSRFPIAIFWGPQYALLYNDAYIPVLGAAKHPAWMGMSGCECWHEVWPTVGPIMQGVRACGEPFWSEDFMLVLDRRIPREECYFTFSYSAIPDGDAASGGVLCICTETTQRVLGERRLRILRELGGRALLARSEGDAADALAQILAASGAELPFALLYLLDHERRLARLAALSGLERGGPAAPAAIDIHTGGRADDPWRLREAILGGRPIALESLEIASAAVPEPVRCALVLPLTGSGGTLGFLVAGVSPRRVLDERYRAFFNLVAGHIATGLVMARAFDEERRRARALAELDSAKTVFFSNVSHEFRTPLTLMIGPLEDALADTQAPLPPRQRERIDAAFRNSLRLLKLVNTLLDFSRLEAGRVRACFEPVDLAALTQELASSFRSACERGGLGLEVRCGQLPQPVYVDRDLWEKIVLNLVSNAFKFTLRGAIEVTLQQVGGAVELIVSDTGIGIASEEVPRLFERFHRVPGAQGRTMEGTGIGLALVHELVRLHGGSVRVESDLGAGSRFIVRLPFGPAQLPAEQIGGERLIAPTSIGARPFVEEALRWLPPGSAGEPEPLPTQATVPAPQIPSEADNGPRTRPLILCADDNADLRCYVSRLLVPLYDVIAVGDGEQALETALTYRPDLIVADVMMPKMSGVMLLKALRAASRTAMIPVLLLSARAGEEAKIEGLDAGADDYLEKPFSARELLARVRSQLALSGARRAHEREREDFHTVFMQAPNVFYIVRGPEYRVELANAAACRVLRRASEELLGQPLFAVVPELAATSFRSILDTVMRTGVAYQGRETSGLVHWRGEIGPRVEYYNYVFSPLRSGDGGIEGVLVDAFCVTEEVIARQEMARLRAEAESANRMKDEFLAMLGHELRNPLAPMVMALQVMRLRGGTSREQEILERQVSHLTRLMDDLLDVSRVTRGKIELRRRPLEISEVVTGAAETVAPLFTQRRHRLEIDVAAAGLLVLADPERLTQVLMNLLTNAAKYSEPGSAIHVHARRAGGRIELCVRDEGMGIAPEMLEKVFDIFVQQPQTLDRAAGGLGLGLAIVRSLIEMHEGTVSARSAGPGKGSEFIIDLPALDPRQPAAPEPVRSWSSLVPARERPAGPPELP
ncbi:MAG TPA: ATP-binding protein [Steroidobacteraceae bacterium]|jgi:signal transduction histidine kinase|nr:ATP-binding protein [Steroidobacteraceae bacterium]